MVEAGGFHETGAGAVQANGTVTIIDAGQRKALRLRIEVPVEDRPRLRARLPEIAAAFDELGTLYELDGAVRYRVNAYRDAARTIRECPVSVEELAKAGRATELPGVGKTLEQKIVTLVDTGEIPSAVKLKAKFPPTLIAVMLVAFGLLLVFVPLAVARYRRAVSV